MSRRWLFPACPTCRSRRDSELRAYPTHASLGIYNNVHRHSLLCSPPSPIRGSGGALTGVSSSTAHGSYGLP